MSESERGQAYTSLHLDLFLYVAFDSKILAIRFDERLQTKPFQFFQSSAASVLLYLVSLDFCSSWELGLMEHVELLLSQVRPWQEGTHAQV